MLKPVFDVTVLKKLLRVVVFNMPFRNKFVQVILGDADNGWWPEDKDLGDLAATLKKMGEDNPKNFGDTSFFITHGAVKFRPFSIDKLKKKIVFITVGDDNHRYDDVEFKKIELEVKSAFESAKLSTTRCVVLRHPVQFVEADVAEEVLSEQARKPGVDTKPPKPT